METLAYLHLALAHEAPTDSDYRALTSTWESLKQISRGTINQIWNQPKLSTKAAVSLLGVSITLGILGIVNQASAAVQEGSRGEDVTALQQRLQELGYFEANITGYFGSLTKQAVIEFQQEKGLEANGIVETDTLVAMSGQPKPSSKPVRQPSSQPVRESSTRFLQLGNRGAAVRALQESLAAAGFPSSSNSIFDQATQKAVMRFQQAKKLTVDGIVGPKTWAALPAIGGQNASSPRRNPSSRSTSRATTRLPAPRTTIKRSTSRTTTSRSTPKETTRLPAPRTAIGSLNTPSNTPSFSTTEVVQRRLKELGFYPGEIDGIWGPQTQAAVEAAQRSYDVSSSDIQQGSL